jgi:hypothetical protein
LQPDYPRPQLVRASWLNLNGAWRFIFDPRRQYRIPGEIDHWPLTINVPFPPEAPASGIGDGSFQSRFSQPISVTPHSQGGDKSEFAGRAHVRKRDCYPCLDA